MLRTLSVLGSGVRTESSRFCCFLQEARKPPRAVNIELPTQCSMTIQRNLLKRKITPIAIIYFPIVDSFSLIKTPKCWRSLSTFLHLPRSPSAADNKIKQLKRRYPRSSSTFIRLGAPPYWTMCCVFQKTRQERLITWVVLWHKNFFWSFHAIKKKKE